jgi:hypothetical protein
MSNLPPFLHRTDTGLRICAECVIEASRRELVTSDPLTGRPVDDHRVTGCDYLTSPATCDGCGETIQPFTD